MIRPATSNDLPALRELLRAGGLAIDGVAYDDFTPPVLVAERDGEILGMIQALLGKPYSVITEFVVTHNVRHAGVGHELLGAMEALMQRVGLTTWIGYIAGTRPYVQRIAVEYGAVELGYGGAYMKRIPNVV